MKNWDKFFSWYASQASCTYISYSFKNFFPQVHKSFPYLTTKQFPHNWAIADMVKGYIVGMRKEHHCQAHEEGHGEVTTKKTTCSNDASDTEDNSPIKNNSHSAPKSTKCLRDHGIDDTSELEDDSPSQTSSKKTTCSSSHPKSNKRRVIDSDFYAGSELEDADDAPSQTSIKKITFSSSHPKPNKCRAIDSDIHAGSKPEDISSQVNSKKITHPSSHPKLKKCHIGDSGGDIYKLKDAPSTKKSIPTSGSTKLGRLIEKQDAPTRQSTCLIITPGKCELPSNSVHRKDTHHDDFAPKDPLKK